MERTHGISKQERFMKEFIALYKQQALLWDTKNPLYRNRTEREEAYGVLLTKCREYYSNADEDFVRTKIDSMRSSFRKEHRKVRLSRETATKPEDIYKPSLWYYELLLFVAGEEPGNKLDDKATPEADENYDDNVVRIPFWSREESALLIKLYQDNSCLYDPVNPMAKNKRKRRDTLKKITQELTITTGKSFDAEDVRRKIGLLRGQFLYEYKKVRKNEAKGEDYSPTLWCYELLRFLEGQYSDRSDLNGQNGEEATENKMTLREKPRKRKYSSDDDSEDDDLWDFNKKDSDNSVSSDIFHNNSSTDDCKKPRKLPESTREDDDEDEDIYDVIAKNVSHKLRDMTDHHRKIAQKILNDLMYHGQMEHLTPNSRLSLDGK